jgi:hypothetical protein
MLRITLSALCLCAFLATPVSAEDVNQDGLDDSLEDYSGEDPVGVGMIGIVDNGDISRFVFRDRLEGLGYTVSFIPLESTYWVLIIFDLVILPVGHASACCNSILAANADDYHQYVAEGGCLYVSQPNPWNFGPGYSSIPWVPYDLVIDSHVGGCPSVIVDPDHCISQGLQDGDLPSAADIVLEMGPEWNIVATDPAGRPSVFTAPFGAGNVLVELANPSPSAFCPYTDAALDNMVSCCSEGEPTAIEVTTWGRLKALYR